MDAMRLNETRGMSGQTARDGRAARERASGDHSAKFADSYSGAKGRDAADADPGDGKPASVASRFQSMNGARRAQGPESSTGNDIAARSRPAAAGSTEMAQDEGLAAPAVDSQPEAAWPGPDDVAREVSADAKAPDAAEAGDPDEAPSNDQDAVAVPSGGNGDMSKSASAIAQWALKETDSADYRQASGIVGTAGPVENPDAADGNLSARSTSPTSGAQGGANGGQISQPAGALAGMMAFNPAVTSNNDGFDQAETDELRVAEGGEGQSDRSGLSTPRLGADTIPSVRLDPGLSLRALTSATVEILQSRDGGAIDIALSPEELGKVRLSLISHNGAITVQVNAERPETLDLLRRHIDLLSTELRQIGYADISFTFGRQNGGRPAIADRDGDQGRATAEPMVPATMFGSSATLGVPQSGLDLRL